VAAIGNIFLGDDGFGVEVLQELEQAELPPWVQIADYGIAGMRSALIGDYDTAILIDATPHGRSPGTLSLIEADTSDLTTVSALDTHGMRADAVFRLLRLLGGDAGRILILSCEPACLDGGIGLSPAVETAVPIAVRAVTDLTWGATPALVSAAAEGVAQS
jgi:hydrogenase maturation protease